MAWVWDRDLHGEAIDLRPVEVAGKTEAQRKWLFHDGFCGIGGATAGFVAAGGEVVGAFDRDAQAREIYASSHGVEPKGELGEVLREGLEGTAEVYVAAAPGRGFERNGRGGTRGEVEGKREGLMLQQLELHLLVRSHGKLLYSSYGQSFLDTTQVELNKSDEAVAWRPPSRMTPLHAPAARSYSETRSNQDPYIFCCSPADHTSVFSIRYRLPLVPLFLSPKTKNSRRL